MKRSLALIVAGLLVVAGCGDDDEVASTTTTSRASTTIATTATTAPAEAETAVWPASGSARRYDDPEAAALGFATELVGFVDPLIGEFQQGDARSGEIEIAPVPDGPTTVVFVRQLGADGSWWVLGAATNDIVVDEPAAGDRVGSTFTVAGSALAFEGTVQVRVFEDGQTEPLAETFVTGGGDVARPFTGEVTLEREPTAERGALVLTAEGGDDGRVWQATVLRVAFA